MPDDSLINTILESILKEAMGLNTSSIGLSSLKHALTRRMRYLGMDSTPHYIKLLKTSNQELNELIEEVTVNETWFFRDEAPFIALRDYAKNFLNKHKGQTLQILSVPCSTGEEPYSIAMTLIEAGIPSHAFTIDAVDISRRSLAIAQKGTYRSHSFRGPHAQKHQSYFTKTNEGYALDQNIKNLVNFHRGNLIHLARPLANTTYQVIFCRNLLIYLDNSFHQQTINTFDSILADNGLLVIGHAEAGILSNSCFTPAPYPKAFAFQKKLQDSRQPLLATRLPPESKAALHQNLAQDTKAIHSLLDIVQSSLVTSTTQAPFEGYKGKATLADECNRAIRACEDRIRKDGPSSEIFYHLATLFEQKKEWQLAIKMLKKALYLDPNSIDAIDMMAAIYQRLGDDSNYLACLKRGQRIITRLSSPTPEVSK
jgi:chemotaxis protein methyltransferase WspC